MLDIKFIREHPDLVKEKSKRKGYSIDVEKLLKVDAERRKTIEEVDKLRSDRKKAAELRNEAEGQKIKLELKTLENKLEKLQEEYYLLAREVPNLPKEDVPFGLDDSENQPIREVGKISSLDFKPKDHLELGIALDLIDMDRAAKVSGSRFAYIKNELVLMEFALIQYVLETLKNENFIPIIPPVIVNKKPIDGLGYPEYQSGEGYKIDDQYLVGTAEHSIVPMHMDDVFAPSDLPKRYLGFSTAFRKEAGTYGKDTKGIFRVHQFDKLEMVSFVHPNDEDKEHEYLLSIEEKLVSALELPYRVLSICTGDLGFPASRKYDIEVWLPSQNQYRETHSVSTCGQFQARRLNIKYKEGEKSDFVAILNGTAFAIGRTLIAIMENYQQKDGSILVPKVLQKYTGFNKIPA